MKHVESDDHDGTLVQRILTITPITNGPVPNVEPVSDSAPPEPRAVLIGWRRPCSSRAFIHPPALLSAHSAAAF